MLYRKPYIEAKYLNLSSQCKYQNKTFIPNYNKPVNIHWPPLSAMMNFITIRHFLEQIERES